jgi:MFS family permease
MTDLSDQVAEGAGAGTPGPAPAAGTAVARASASRRLVVAYVCGQFGLDMAVMTPVVVAVPLKISQVTGGSKTGSLSLVMAVGAFLSMVATPLWGRLSDRTTGRFGRRRPWLVCGVLGGAAGLLTIGMARNTATVLAGWAVTHTSLAATYAALITILPEHVPRSQRGRVAGALGLTGSSALVLGTFLAQVFPGRVMPVVVIPAAVAVVANVVLAVVLPDRPAARGRARGVPARPRPSLRAVATALRRGSFLRSDLGRALLMRLLFNLGWAFFSIYELYLLTDRLHHGDAVASRMLFHVTVAGATAAVAGASLSGWLSDRLGRRRVFVVVAALITSAGLLVAGTATGDTRFFVGGALACLGSGMYAATDMALVSEVLPDPRRAAQDLGVVNIGNSLPHSLAPAIAAGVIALCGGTPNYPALFVTASAFCLLSTVAASRITAVR